MKRKKSVYELTHAALFVALLLGVQTAFSALPGVELVTVLFVSYAYSFGVKRSTFVATAFSIVRQLVFGAFLKVLILYLVYFNLLCLVFGLLGKKERPLWLVVLVACLCTAFFTLFDNLLTPLYYGFTASATKAYFIASLPFALPQIVCTFFTVGSLFLPLTSFLIKG